MNKYLYWKYLGGVLLNFLLENENKQTMIEFHKGYYGGHYSWKGTADKIFRVLFYWNSMSSDTYKGNTTCHQCQIFDGKRKVVSLPLNPISVEAPFQ